MAQVQPPETQSNTPPNSPETGYSPSTPANVPTSSQTPHESAAERKADTPVKTIRITDWASI
ncbi:hypothetical protein ACFFUT_15995 [Pseudohalocynthiibacter aestuariivivens]|uniref:Uncharacterized protein n=1 Tax=Pseudohalocynthiibacter aestuariivivens TaxID=1591409 RepID=A0ABV5JIK5_9RHOB|nr:MULTISPECIES: hypothetical protein [Pseudohalocynthiibacter]MBS9716523.1 hypothetical protein [Pseudohalocynthiibacter aestuariivivens]